MNEQATKISKGDYLEKPNGKKEKVREQMLYGDGESLLEKEKKKEEYQDKELNEYDNDTCRNHAEV
jgi:hypothetical protein